MTNVEIASLFLGWCLEIGTIVDVCRLAMEFIWEEWRGGLEDIMLKVRIGNGLMPRMDDWMQIGDTDATIHPFLI